MSGLVNEALAEQQIRTRESWERSLELLLQATAEGERRGDRIGEARARMHLGRTLYMRGSVGRAREQLEAALPVLEEAGTVQDRAMTVVELAVATNKQRAWAPELYELALQYARQGQDLAVQAEDPALVSRVGLVHASLAWVRDDLPSALRLAELAVEAARLSPDPVQEASALRLLGFLYKLDGHRDQAERLFMRVADLGTRVGSHSAVARAHLELGGLLAADGDVAGTLELYRVALDEALRSPAVWLEGDVLRRMANVYAQSGRIDSTLHYLARARDAYVEAGDDSGLASADGLSGEVYSALGRHEEARAVYEEARSAAAEAGATSLAEMYRLAVTAARSALLNEQRGRTLFNSGQLVANPAVDSVMASMERLEFGRGIPAGRVARDLLAGLRDALGDEAGEMSPEELGRRYARAVGRTAPRVAADVSDLRRRASDLTQSGRYDEAISALQEARSSLARDGDLGILGLVLNDLSGLMAETGKLVEAAELAALARLHFSRLGTAQGMSLAEYQFNRVVRRSGNDRQGLAGMEAQAELQTFNRAAVEAGDRGRRDIYYWVEEAGTLNRIAQLAALPGGSGDRTAAAYADSAAALRSRLAVYAGEEPDRLSFTEEDENLYGRWTLSYLDQGSQLGTRTSSLAALGAAEQGRAQALLDLMRGSSQEARAGANLADEVSGWLKGVGAPVLTYTIAAEFLIGWLVEPDGEVISYRRPLVPETRRRQLESLLTYGEADKRRWATDSLAYLISDLRFAIGAVGGKDPGDGELGEPRPDNPILGFQRIPSGPARPDFAQANSTLTDLLVPPEFTERLPNSGELIVVPQGPLNLVPFAALTPAGLDEPLGARFAIRYAPSLATLAQAESSAGVSPSEISGSEVLVVGNPSMPSEFPSAAESFVLDPLRGAEREGIAVAERLGGTVLTANAATETSVRSNMERASVVHLATHGLAYSAEHRARDSWIALAADDVNDGFLTAGEMLDMDARLRAELVVLSACETGLGVVNQAEGTVGLQRALLARGARSVLVSQWKVDDDATAMLMDVFYDEWLGGEGAVSKSEALRRAIQVVRRDYPEPINWAAFQLVGAG